MINKIIMSCLLIIFLNLMAYSTTNYANTGKPSQYALLENGKLRVAYHYSKGNDLWIDFEKCGTNMLMSINKLYMVPSKINNTSPNLNSDAEADLFFKSYSDWISPYIAKANNNGYSNNTLYAYTGGWHDINKKATAYTSKYEVIADGKPLQQKKVTACTLVNLKVVNLIQGYNTVNVNNKARYILQETVNYIIFRNSIEINVEIKALENLKIYRYYGLQTMNTSWKGEIYYISSTKAPLIYNSTIASNSNDKAVNNGIYKFYIQSNTGDRLTAWLDRNTGLGKMKYVADNIPCAFTPFSKSYFNLINGQELSLSTGSKEYWHGGYEFKYVI